MTTAPNAPTPPVAGEMLRNRQLIDGLACRLDRMASYAFPHDAQLYREEAKALRALLTVPDREGGEALPNKTTVNHPDAYLNALLDYSRGLYGLAITYKIPPREMADAVNHLERAARGLHALALLATPSAGDDETQEDVEELCFVCIVPFKLGDMVIQDVSGGVMHRACAGEDRNAYVKDTETGEPLGPDDPLPVGTPWKPWPESMVVASPTTSAATPDGEWIEWKGGLCPVDLNAAAEIRCRSGSVNLRTAGSVLWHHTPSKEGWEVLAYRLAAPPPPSEVEGLRRALEATIQSVAVSCSDESLKPNQLVAIFNVSSACHAALSSLQRGAE